MPDDASLRRRRAEITRAFVDRRPIDWAALLDRAAGPGDHATLEVLRRLDALRGGPCPGQELEQPQPWTTVLQVMVVIGAAQVLVGLAHLVSVTAYGDANWALAPNTLLTGVFAAASLMLGSAVARDRRVYFLLAAFVLTASAFARALVITIQNGGAIASIVTFRGLYPEAFAPAALWQFVAAFPSVRRFTTFDVVARRAASLAGVLGAGLFVANFFLAYGLLPEWCAVLGRDDPRRAFWQVFAWSTFPALAVIVIRTHRASWNERAKVVRFGWAIGAGAGPILAVGVAETIPRVAAWMATANVRPSIDVVVMSALAAMPILAAFGVLVEGTFAPQLGPKPVADGWADRARNRLDTLRARAMHPRRHQERLSIALDRVRLARGSREIRTVLQRELQAGIATSWVSILQVCDLPPGTALLPILEQASAPIDLSRTGEPFVLLPLRDREWLDGLGAALMAAVRLRDGTTPAVILIGHAVGADSFSRSDRWFIATLLTGASAAWDAASPFEHDDECADECERCGRVQLPGRSACCAGEKTRLAALPKRLGDRFIVTRRLGAGGMGIVYLGHDFSLGRDVALKTWTGVHEEMMTRLRVEARLMATLNHDALATIYGLEQWRGTPVLVMEYCAQGTLADIVSRAALSVHDILHLGIRLADGLTYMHGRGVLHRDIKPSNIGFTLGGIAKLLDFGLAGADDQSGGTLAYLPPEALADGATAGAAIDLWGLATVLSEACRTSGVDGEPLDAFFQRALAARPADRFQSSLEMRAALCPLLAHVNLMASPDRPASSGRGLTDSN